MDLIEESDNEKDEDYKSFYLKLNNEAIFIKGASYASMNIYKGKEDLEKMKKVIDIAIESNLNTLRVWGGGIYESD